MAMLTDRALGQLRMAGLARPRSSAPGQEWQPRTDAEQHLLREGYRLDRIRQLLLEEVGRLRRQVAATPRTEALAAAARSARRLSGCPLSPAELGIIAAAAAGESLQDTADRLCVAYDTVSSQRKRAVARMDAHNIAHAVALAVAAGWVTPRQVTEGIAP